MRKLISLYLLVFPVISFSQSLLLNGGFEEENVCTEYDAKCAPEAWVHMNGSLDNYIRGFARSHSGEYCYALQVGNTRAAYKRSFIRTRLVCGMRPGTKYRFTAFVKSPYDVLDSIGILFTSEDIFYMKKAMKDVLPDFYFGNTFNRKDTSWQKIEIVYTARGDEAFFTIGNFSKKDITGPNGNRFSNQFNVFIDDLSLEPMDAREKLCADWLTRKQEIYSQNERHQSMERLIRMKRYNTMTGDSLISRMRLLKIDTLVLPDVLFTVNSATLQTGSYAKLDSLANIARRRKLDSIVVKGYTDSTGTVARNEKLSKDRAATVATYLQSRVGGGQLPFFTYGLGDLFPVAENSSPQGRQRNRRVEILLYTKESE